MIQNKDVFTVYMLCCCPLLYPILCSGPQLVGYFPNWLDMMCFFSTSRIYDGEIDVKRDQLPSFGRPLKELSFSLAAKKWTAEFCEGRRDDSPNFDGSGVVTVWIHSSQRNHHCEAKQQTCQLKCLEVTRKMSRKVELVFNVWFYTTCKKVQAQGRILASKPMPRLWITQLGWLATALNQNHLMWKNYLNNDIVSVHNYLITITVIIYIYSLSHTNLDHIKLT